MTERRRRHAGFTLLELLVAMAIFAVIGAMALGGLNAVVDQGGIAGVQMARLAELQRAMRVLTADLGGIQPRFVRDELGTAGELPLVTDGRGEFLLRLTRGGWSNPSRAPYRGTLQRLQYRLQDDVLIREYWTVTDRVLGEKPRQEELLTGVERLELSYLDQGREWVTQWPPPSRSAPGNGERPRAIRLKLTLEDFGVIERVVEVVQ
ncbi:MAG: type II secretion system minor pseudopilin GspJ [Chromatiales bacterium]|nr:type II secretion system minor pseudopilin GspJ [Chromatiales bacterium]